MVEDITIPDLDGIPFPCIPANVREWLERDFAEEVTKVVMDFVGE